MTDADNLENLLATAAALLDWAREHTSPRPPNSPHGLIVDLQAELAVWGWTVGSDGITRPTD